MECYVTILPSFLIVGLDENLTDQWLSNIQTVNIRSPYMAYHIHCQVSTLTIALINTTIIAINSSLLNTQSYATLCMSYIFQTICNDSKSIAKHIYNNSKTRLQLPTIRFDHDPYYVAKYKIPISL